MCLHKVTKHYSRPLSKERVAWKILERRDWDACLYTPYNGYEVAKPGVWMKAVPTRIETNFYEPDMPIEWYQTGFHTFKTRKIAETACSMLTPRINRVREIFPVLIKGITCYGPDGASIEDDYIKADLTTFVSKKMRLLREDEITQYLAPLTAQKKRS